LHSQPMPLITGGEGGVIVQAVLTDRWCLAHGYSQP
jgi:hypothetical protein